MLIAPPVAEHDARPRPFWRSDTALLVYAAAATVVLHWVAAAHSPGFHRDELATLDDARHLAWGYVAYPPVTPFFARLSLVLFGTSLPGFRFFAAIAQAVALVLTGLISRDLGGRRGAQLLALAAALPACLAAGALMQYVSFDYLAWVLVAFSVVRLLKTGDPRWWIAVGASVGFGMMAKYAMPFLVAGVVIGFLLTSERRQLAGRWFWLGVAVALLVFLPNLVWQVQHHFIYLDFVRHIHARDVRVGRTQGFLPDQLKFTLLAAPLWIAGLYFCLIAPAGRRFRSLAWMYLVPLILFVIARGRGYYLLGAYPMLYAAGSVWGEQWAARLRPAWRNLARGVAWTALALDAALLFAIALPLASPNSRWWQFASQSNGDLREEVGWPELVQTVAQVRDSLPPGQRAALGILAGNYGEAGAITLYGPSYGLPTPSSGANSFWARGYGDPPPRSLIVVGISRGYLDRNFHDCRLVAHTWNRFGVANEETRDHPDIFFCAAPLRPWPLFWSAFRYFG